MWPQQLLNQTCELLYLSLHWISTVVDQVSSQNTVETITFNSSRLLTKILWWCCRCRCLLWLWGGYIPLSPKSSLAAVRCYHSYFASSNLAFFSSCSILLLLPNTFGFYFRSNPATNRFAKTDRLMISASWHPLARLEYAFTNNFLSASAYSSTVFFCFYYLSWLNWV